MATLDKNQLSEMSVSVRLWEVYSTWLLLSLLYYLLLAAWKCRYTVIRFARHSINIVMYMLLAQNREWV